MSVVDQLLAAFGGGARGGLDAYGSYADREMRKKSLADSAAMDYNNFALRQTAEERQREADAQAAREFAEQIKIRQAAEARAAEALRLQNEDRDAERARREKDDDRKEKLTNAQIERLLRMTGGGGGSVSGGNAGATGSLPGGVRTGAEDLARLMADAKAARESVAALAPTGTPQKDPASLPGAAPRMIAPDPRAASAYQRAVQLMTAKEDSANALNAAGVSGARTPVTTRSAPNADEAPLLAEFNRKAAPYIVVMSNPSAPPEVRRQAQQAFQQLSAAFNATVVEYRKNKQAMGVR